MIKCIIIFMTWFVSCHQYSTAHGTTLDTFGCQRDAQASVYQCFQGEYLRRYLKSRQDVVYLANNREEFQNFNATGKLLEHIRLSGKASVTDGDTIRFGKTRVRLYGIAARDLKQKCIFND